MAPRRWPAFLLLVAPAIAAQGCTTALWEAHRAQDRTLPLGRATLPVDRMVEDLARNGLAFRLAPRPEDLLPPRLAEDYSKGYAWVRLEQPYRLGFLGKALALGHAPWQPERVEIVVKRVESKGGRLHHSPVLLHVFGRMPRLALRRAAPPAEEGPDLLDAVRDDDLRIALGLATNAVMRHMPAAWGGRSAMDIHLWRAVLREGKPLDDPLAPIRAAIEQQSIAPLSGCEVVIRRHRPGDAGDALYVRAPLDVLFCMIEMQLDTDGWGQVWTWQGYWKGQTDESPDAAQVRPARAHPTLRAVVEEYEIHNDSTLVTVLLTPFTLAGDLALMGLVAWAEGESDESDCRP